MQNKEKQNAQEEGEKRDLKEYPEIENDEQLTAREPVVLYGPLDLDETKQYTYADYLTWFDDKRRELINGFIHLLSAPLRKHMEANRHLYRCLDNYIIKRKGNCKVYFAPFDVRLPIHGGMEDDKIYDTVQPDICVVCDLSKLDEKGCIGAPDMIVEIESKSTKKKDWVDKMDLYQRAGVKEYWIVSYTEKTVNVFLLKDDGLFDNGTFYENGKIPVKTLPGLEIEVDEIFAE